MQFVEDTIFAYFAGTECSGLKSVAISLNPSQPDFTPPFTVRGVSFVEVDPDARLFFGKSETTAAECASVCDSYNFAAAVDVDGSLTGTANSMVLGENAPLVFSYPKCDSVFAWGAFQCTDTVMRMTMLSVLQGDPNAQTLGPVTISRIDPDAPGAVRKYFSHGDYKDMCPDIMPGLRFRWLTSPGYEHEIMTTNTLPDRTRFQFFSADESESVLVKLFMEKPLVIDMFVDGEAVPGSTDAVPTLVDAAGSNQLNPQGACNVVVASV